MPILLQFPQDILRHGWKDASKHSMLGLGDIVIPGIFIALLRRFDLRIGDKDTKKKQGGRYFFSITVIAYAVGLLITMLVMHHFKAMSSCSLYAMSLLCIIVGGIRSANFVKRQILKKRPLEASISMSEAKKFPFTASLVLFTLYLFFKLASKLPEDVHPYLEYIPSVTKAHVMKLLLILICYEGCVALAALLKPLFSFVLSLLPIGNRRPRLNIPYFLSIKKGTKEMEEGDIEDAKKSDFAGSLLLVGLFIYDVFWVFATDVMTSVAKGIDAPILLQFPQDILRHGWKDASKHSMLGLGDIVIPGIFIALLRRFDLRIGDKDTKKKQGGRYFFSITVIAYAVGLLITMLVMHHFKAAQPALLYLVARAAFGATLFAVLSDRRAKELWNYDEEHLTDKHEKEKAKKVDASKKTN
ncbi:signal peptide peptidase [Ostertagia ostertagi]